MSLKEMAASVAAEGRKGDRHLLHITDDELHDLMKTGKITRNPKTGAYEAFNFGGFLRSIVGSGGGALIGNLIAPGIGGVIGGALGGAATSPNNRALGAIGGAIGGPGIASGAEGLISGAGGAAGVASDAAAVEGGGYPMPAPGAPIATNPASVGMDLSGLGTEAFAPFGETGAAPGGGVDGGAAPGATPSAVPGAGPDGSLPTLPAAGAPAAVPAATNMAEVMPKGGASSPAVGGSTPLGSSMGQFTDFLKDNKNLILPGLSLGAAVLKPAPGVDPNVTATANEMRTRSTALNTQAQDMISSAQSGKLTPGAESAVTNALQDATGSIKAKYAQLGMSGSTAEAQELASANSRSEAMKFELAQQLTKTGLSAAGIADNELANASQLYSLIMNSELKTDSELRNALANFAGAAAVGGGLNKK